MIDQQFSLAPLSAAVLPEVWKWLNEFPENNFDDYAPKAYAAWRESMLERMKTERVWAVKTIKGPVGAIAYLPITPRLGMFHGICFAKSVHGTGIPLCAVRDVLELLFSESVEKVQACFFASNEQVRRFLHKLGAVEEGLLRAQTVQDGKLIDMRMMAIFAYTWCYELVRVRAEG